MALIENELAEQIVNYNNHKIQIIFFAYLIDTFSIKNITFRFKTFISTCYNA